METTLSRPHDELLEVLVTPGSVSSDVTLVRRTEGKAGSQQAVCYGQDCAPVPAWQDSGDFLQFVLSMPEAQGLRLGWVVQADPKSGIFHAMILTGPQAVIAIC